MADYTGGILQSHLLLPLWGDGRSQSDFAKNDRIQLEREVGSHATYRFRIAEDLTARGTRRNWSATRFRPTTTAWSSRATVRRFPAPTR